MGKAKDIFLRPITRQEADALVKRVHYSGKVVNNSQFHIGVYYQGKIEGAMQFGPSLDKRKIQPLVSGTLWNEFIELNRMAFSDVLPRNSESRALGIAMRMLRQHAPHIQWAISFADGAQCGDGTIYRAAGFVLTGIKENNQIWSAPDGEYPSVPYVSPTRRPARGRELDKIFAGSFTMQGSNITETGAASMKPFIEAGYMPIPGYQLRYIYFLDPTARARLTVPELPYSEIERRGAGMYKGQPRAGSIAADAPAIHAGEDGAAPIPALQVTNAEH